MSALASNLLAFGRVLRRAGLPVGAADTLVAAEALSHVPLRDRPAFRAALRATMIHRRDHFEVFDAAFDLFWRVPDALVGAPVPVDAAEGVPAASRRAAEAMPALLARPDPSGETDRRADATLTSSDRERLQSLDFEAMTAEELAAAKREMRRLVLPLAERPTRRFRPDPAGPRIDPRGTLRTALRLGGEVVRVERRRRVTRPPPLVLLCDVSGSMARYAQILLHFMHAATNDRARVHSFVFGTRLTNITRALRHRDPEVAFHAVARILPDWSGGTRIGEAIDHFNRRWARRVLGQGAVVLLITDGLDRGGAEGLSEAAARLRRSCRRLIWLNPLLRYAGFQPRAAGIRALLPLVHEHRQVHNLNSLRALVATLSADGRHDGRPA